MKVFAFLLILLMLVMLAACAPAPNSLQGTPGAKHSVAGFWLGFWQGFIAPFVFVISLFRSDLNIYEVHNNGGLYNFGFLFGLACFLWRQRQSGPNSASIRPATLTLPEARFTGCLLICSSTVVLPSTAPAKFSLTNGQRPNIVPGLKEKNSCRTT